MCGRTAVPHSLRSSVFDSSSTRAGGRHLASFYLSPAARLLACPLFSVSAISPYRLAGRMRAPFLLAHSPASFVGGWSYRFPFRLVPRLACPSRVGVSCLFFAARSSIRFISSICRCLVVPSRSAVRLLFLRPARRFSVSCLARLIVSHRLARLLVKQSVFSLFAWRLVSTARRADWVLSVSRLILFCSRIISLVRLMAMGTGGGSSCYCLVAVCFFPCCHPSSLRSWRWRNGRAVRRYGGTRRFIQLVSPSGKDDEGRYG